MKQQRAGNKGTPVVQGKVILLLLALLILATSNLFAQTSQSPSNYQNRFINPQNGVYLKDNNVWVYTTAFAQRFGMPAEWIDDSLQGAEAVAYRVEWSSLQECGWFGEKDNCRPRSDCLLDIYLTDSDSSKLPWKSDRPQQTMHIFNSVRFLTAQTEQDSRTWDPVKQRSDIYRGKIGLDSINWVSGPPREGKVYSGSSDGVSMLAYDREIFTGLDFLQLAVDCNFPTQKERVRLFFMEKFPDRDDYDVSYDELVEKKQPKVFEFIRVEKEWYRDYAEGTVPHTVSFPDSYMARVNEYDRTQYQPKSLATEVEQRINPASSEPLSWWQKLLGKKE